MIDAQTLACGHPPSPHDEYTTGTAIESDTGREVCWGCATAMQRADMAKRHRTGEPVTAYLSSDGASVTTWNDDKLGTVYRTRRAGNRWDPSLSFVWVRDLEGRHWLARNGRRGMYLTLRPLKSAPAA